MIIEQYAHASAVLMVLLITTMGASEVRAQFGRVPTQSFSGGVTVINGYTPPIAGVPKRLNVNLGALITRKWQQVRSEMEAKAPAFFNERAIGPDRGSKSFRTSKTHLQLSNALQLFTGVDGRGFTIRALIPGNRFSTFIRTPGAAPEGLDPGFKTQFDVEITLDVDIQDTRLVSRPAMLKLNLHRPSGKNLTGKAAVVVVGLIKEFGGPDWVGQVQKMVNARGIPIGPAITLELSKLSPILSQAPGTVGLNPGYDPATRNVTFTAVHAQPFREPH
jgi:hypothetical protein